MRCYPDGKRITCRVDYKWADNHFTAVKNFSLLFMCKTIPILIINCCRILNKCWGSSLIVTLKGIPSHSVKNNRLKNLLHHATKSIDTPHIRQFFHLWVIVAVNCYCYWSQLWELIAVVAPQVHTLLWLEKQRSVL